jgi:hypothetical protein
VLLAVVTRLRPSRTPPPWRLRTLVGELLIESLLSHHLLGPPLPYLRYLLHACHIQEIYGPKPRRIKCHAPPLRTKVRGTVPASIRLI